MIVEVLRSLTDWLNDPTTGVAAQLALIPRDGSDPAPTVGLIADETRNNLVAQERAPALPGIGVNLLTMPQLDGEVATVTRDGIAEVLIRIYRRGADTKDLVRDSSYIARALIRSLRLYNAGTRTRNSIDIYSCESLAIVPLMQTVEDAQVTHGVRGRWQFRDYAP
jgi:hypothetical protein